MTTRYVLACLVLVSACDRLTMVCPGTPARWQVSPDSIDVAARQVVAISVVEFLCGDRHREVIYPNMTIADTTVAWVSNTHRLLMTRAVGTTTLTLSSDGPGEPVVMVVPVVVR